MKIQVRGPAIAIAVPATTNSSAVSINGTSVKAAVPAVTTDVRYGWGRVIPPIIRTGPIPPMVRIGAIRPITITASLTAGGDYGWW